MNTFLWTLFSTSTVYASGGCETTSQDVLKQNLENSLSKNPTINEITVFSSNCRDSFKMTSTNSKTELDITKFTPENVYYQSKTKRVKKKCSVAAVRRSTESTASETRIVSRSKSSNPEKLWSDLRDSLVLSTVFIHDTIEIHCPKHDKPQLLEKLYNTTLYELVGSSPWSNSELSFPFQTNDITSSIQTEYLQYNFMMDIAALSGISLSVLVSFPETSHLFVNNSKFCIMNRLWSKIMQSLRFTIMATFKHLFNTYTLASYNQAAENINSGYLSSNGKFLHEYTETELTKQKISSNYPHDLPIYTKVNDEEFMQENDALIITTKVQKFTTPQQQLASQSPMYSELSPTHLRSLGFTDENNQLNNWPVLPVAVNQFWSIFNLTRCCTTAIMLAMFWSLVFGLMALGNYPPAVMIQAFRRILSFEA